MQAADFLVDEAMLQELCSALENRMFPHDCCLPDGRQRHSGVDDSMTCITQVCVSLPPTPPLPATLLVPPAWGASEVGDACALVAGAALCMIETRRM